MILFKIAVRNVLATPVRTFIIGILVIFGTVLVIVGGSLLSTLEQSMARTVVGSVAGHLQIYSDSARDKLELFAPPVGTPDLGTLESFPRIREGIETIQGVKRVVPMGTDFALVFSGNILDIKFSELRRALEDGDREKSDRLLGHVARIISLLKDEVSNLDGLARKDERLVDDSVVKPADVERASSPEFWRDFYRDPMGNLDFLENRLSALAMDEKMLFLRYIGTDTEAFKDNFSLFEIVDGEMIPPGKRGFLFSKHIYEHQVKHPVATALDKIRDARQRERKIGEDEALTTMVKQLSGQYKDILMQLDEVETAYVAEALAKFLGLDARDPVKLVTSFLELDESNFDARYQFFYDEIAPRVILYQVRVGDTLTIRSFTRSGYPTAVNVKVYGTYQFKGLEKSVLAGVYNLMDMMTFRDLYGYMTTDRKQEISAIKQDAGIERFNRNEAEDAMFGEDAEVIEEVGQDSFDEFKGIDMTLGGQQYNEDLLQKTYDREEIEDGTVIHASVILDSVDSIPRVKAAIEAMSRENGWNLRVVDWSEASGLVGKFIGVIWMVLVISILIIFLVTLVIINNSMVMATLDRTREIGTMRAMGAQRSYVLSMILLEAGVLGFGFGLLGIGLGAGFITWLGNIGIPAFSDELYFIFAGPRLYPMLTVGHFITAFAVVLVVVVASALAPARLATRIAPIRAMQKED